MAAFGIEEPHGDSDYYLANEHDFEGGRFDLVIAWDKQGDGFKNGLICEFKLDSVAGLGQLRKYEQAASSLIEKPQFAFITCSYKQPDFEALKNTQMKWSLKLWWKFLRDWESHLPADVDDNEFRQFRATLWEQLA